jgi:hypothetical protein
VTAGLVYGAVCLICGLVLGYWLGYLHWRP